MKDVIRYEQYLIIRQLHSDGCDENAIEQIFEWYPHFTRDQAVDLFDKVTRVTHSLQRTSPKGEKFIGVCTLCGKTDLPIKAALDYCENPRNVTQDAALLAAIKGEKQ